MRIRTVLCPVDFSGLDDAGIAMASEICRAFDATLVLHHNLAAAVPGFSRAWEWTAAHEGHREGIPDAEARLRRLMGKLGAGVRTESVITCGPVGQVVLSLADGLQADLVVLGSHGWSSQDHASVTERLVDESPCPVLTFREGADGVREFHLADDDRRVRVVVATDLSHDSASGVGYACALARRLPLVIDLLHVLPEGSDDAAVAHAQTALDAHVPPDLVDRVTAHVRVGPPVETIADYVEEAHPAFVIMGEHTHGLVRRLLTRDTTRAVMHEIGCPVWIVPPAMAV
jgi:nucleotide-binding universal stress UspA family protein